MKRFSNELFIGFSGGCLATAAAYEFGFLFGLTVILVGGLIAWAWKNE